MPPPHATTRGLTLRLRRLTHAFAVLVLSVCLGLPSAVSTERDEEGACKCEELDKDLQVDAVQRGDLKRVLRRAARCDCKVTYRASTAKHTSTSGIEGDSHASTSDRNGHGGPLLI